MMKRNLLSRTLLLLLMVVGGVCGAWAQEITATLEGEAMLESASPSTSYAAHNTGITDDDNNVYKGYWCYQKTGNVYYQMLQLKKADSSNAYRIDLPQYGGTIKTITLSVTNASSTNYESGTGITNTLIVCSGTPSNLTTANNQKILEVSSSSASKSYVFDFTTLEDSYDGEGLYITCNNGNAYRVWKILVVYEKPTSDPSSEFTFTNKTPSITFPATTTYTGAYTVATGYEGTIVYEITSNTAGATINTSTGEVTVRQEGIVTVKATASAVAGSFKSSTDTYTLTVTDSREPSGLEYAVTTQTVFVGEVLSAPELTNPNNLTVTYSSSDELIATVDASGNVTGVAAGTAIITASFDGNNEYASGDASYTVNVKKTTPVGALFWESISGHEEDTSDGGSSIKTTDSGLDSDNWASFSNVNSGKGGTFKFGSSKNAGTAKTGKIALTGNGVLTFKVKRYNSSEAGPLTINVSGASATGDLSLSGNTANDEWIDGTVNLSNGNGEVEITFSVEGGKRIYVDDILVMPMVSVDMSTKDYISFCSDKNLDFTDVEGLEALVVTQINETSVSTEAVETVPAGVGVILHKTDAEATSFNVPAVATATKPAKNFLVGVLEATTIGGNDTDYVLKDGVFKKANAGTLAAGKAYLQVKTDANAAPALTIGYGDEGTTGIRSIDNGQLTIDNVYYDLSGRRVAEPTKGVYIVNGKKVVIK